MPRKSLFAELDLHTWLIRGSQRRIVFVNLTDEFTPNKLRREVINKKFKDQKLGNEISIREMSRHLHDFEEKGLVKCQNPDDPYMKLYILTKKGKQWQEKIKSSGF